VSKSAGILVWALCQLLITPALAFTHGNPITVPPPQPYGTFTTYYVSPYGNDANNGLSPLTAWQTINKVNSTLFAAHSAIAFQGGQVFMGGFVINSSVTPGDFAITSYGDGRAIIASGGNKECATVADLSNITFDNIDCEGSDNLFQNTRGIYWSNSAPGAVVLTGHTLTNSILAQYGWDGVFWDQAPSANPLAGFANVTITNNIIHDNTGHITTNRQLGTNCILASGGNSTVNTNITISGNLIYNCTGVSPSLWVAGDGIFLVGFSNALITRNTVHDAGTLNSFCPGPIGIGTTAVNNIVISYNEVYNIFAGTGCDGEGIDMDQGTSNGIVEYNWVHNSTSADIVNFGSGAANHHDNTIRFNIIEAATSTGLWISGISHNIQVYNNTVYSNNPLCFDISTQTDTSIVANNICYATGLSNPYLRVDNNGPNLGLTQVQNNDYFGGLGHWLWGPTTYTTLPNFQTGCGVPCTPAGTTVDPKLVNPGGGGTTNGGSNQMLLGSYFLQGGSPMRTGGLNLQTLFGINPGSVDFYGHPITPSTLPIGAATY
jgi:hypothetical protein